MQPTLPLRVSLMFMGFAIIAGASAQYDGPESVEYDPVGDRYLVSNTLNGLIVQRDQGGSVTGFADVGTPTYGLELLNGVLYACSAGHVKGYATDNAELVFDLNLNGQFLNGITTDGEFLYVTAFTGAKVYKVDVDAPSFSVLVANTNGTPNGIVWDPVAERLVVVFWGSNAPIKAYDRETGAAQTLVANTGLSNIDGVTIDCLGNFLVSSWTPARITRFAPSFTEAGVNLGITGLNSPADIDFDTVNHRVCIPNGPTDEVVLAEIDCSTGLPESRTYVTRVLPNPTTGLVRFDPPFLRAEPFMVLDAKGLLQASGTLRASALLDLTGLPAGAYTILFTRHAQQIRVVKE